jgi:ABC-type transport system involved in multi-copper enzyme maturation permease subunit
MNKKGVSLSLVGEGIVGKLLWIIFFIALAYGIFRFVNGILS